MAQLGAKSKLVEPVKELDYMELMRLEIEEGMRKMAEKAQCAADSGSAVSYIMEIVLDRMMEEVEDNSRRIANINNFMQKSMSEAETNHSPPSHEYTPASPVYNAGPDSPDYTPAPDSPVYRPDSLDYRADSQDLRPDSLDLRTDSLVQTEMPKATVPHYSAGYDSPMANPSPAYPDYRPADSPMASLDCMESAKYRCTICKEKFDIMFEVTDHLKEVHDIDDEEEVLKKHFTEPNTATYAPVPYTDNGPVSQPILNMEEDTYQCKLCDTRMAGMYPMYEHLEDDHNFPDEDQLAENCFLVQNAQVLPDTAVKAPTSPPTPPPVSTIQLVPADSPGYDSGAISDDEEEEIEPPSQVEPDTQLLIQVVQEPGLLAVPRSNSEPSSSRSSSPFNVETIAELKDALARDGDFKFLVSEELTKTKVYQDYMEKYARDQDMGDESATTFHLKQTSEDIEDKGDNMEHVADISDKRMEIGNTSPEVEDRFCPLESLDEKVNQAVMKPVETEGVEMDKTEK